MNAFDLAAVTGVMVELQTCLDQIAGLTKIPPPPGVDVALLHARLEDLQRRLGGVVDAVQDRACRRWRMRDTHNPRHEAPAWIAPKREGPPLSTEVENIVRVKRFGIDGRPLNERETGSGFNSFRASFAAREGRRQ